MKIHFERSGGITGIISTCTIKTESLSPKETIRVEKMVKDAKQVQPKNLENIRGADYFEYRISIQGNDEKFVIETNDIVMDPVLKPLIDFLVRKL